MKAQPLAGAAPAMLKVHLLAERFPEMLTDEYLELVADIKAHGLHKPVVLFEGMILDGRHRWRACIAASVNVRYETFTGTTAEARAYVESLNVHRRHLTLEQKRAIIDAELKRDPKQSDNSISKKAKSTNKTVAARRAKAEANKEIPNKTGRTEASGRKARGRKTTAKAPEEKPLTNAVAAPNVTPGDRVAARLIDEIWRVQLNDLSDSQWFCDQLDAQSDRFRTSASVIQMH